MDHRFRMDMDELRKKLEEQIAARRCIVAVVAIAGTTEEGAVDPIQRVLELRTELETKAEHSFWLHIDAAWGGYVRSVFCDASLSDPQYISRELFEKRAFDLSRKLHVTAPNDDLQSWVDAIEAELGRSETDKTTTSNEVKELQNVLDSAKGEGNYSRVLSFFGHKAERRRGKITALEASDFKISDMDRVAVVKDFVSERIGLNMKNGRKRYSKELSIQWPESDVGQAFLAFPRADSITVDPHKMGYAVYPGGAIAFKNDRVRHFVRQEAPYITSSRASDMLLHMPLRYATEFAEGMAAAQIPTKAFAPFTLEGSRPGSMACSLWLASRTLPFDRNHHGTIVRASLLAARTLYEWLIRWNTIVNQIQVDTDFAFVPYCATFPDTNIVIFAIKEKNTGSVKRFNQLNQEAYKTYSILTELGDRQYSYSHPFFLSSTTFNHNHYSYDSAREFMERNNFHDPEEQYRKHGLFVLRATVMSPYILPTKDLAQQDLILEFVKNIHSVAQKSVSKIKEVSE
jgi:hypothetical protein